MIVSSPPKKDALWVLRDLGWLWNYTIIQSKSWHEDVQPDTASHMPTLLFILPGGHLPALLLQPAFDCISMLLSERDTGCLVITQSRTLWPFRQTAHSEQGTISRTDIALLTHEPECAVISPSASSGLPLCRVQTSSSNLTCYLCAARYSLYFLWRCSKNIRIYREHTSTLYTVLTNWGVEHNQIPHS